MMAAFAGPLVVGGFWRGVTLAGAYTGLVSGMATFILLRSGVPWMIVDPSSLGPLSGIASGCTTTGLTLFPARWSARRSRSPGTWAVSKLTQPLPEDHVEGLFAAPSETVG